MKELLLSVRPLVHELSPFEVTTATEKV